MNWRYWMDPGSIRFGSLAVWIQERLKKMKRIKFGSSLHGYGLWTSFFGLKYFSDGIKFGTFYSLFVDKVTRSYLFLVRFKGNVSQLKYFLEHLGRWILSFRWWFTSNGLMEHDELMVDLDRYCRTRRKSPPTKVNSFLPKDEFAQSKVFFSRPKVVAMLNLTQLNSEWFFFEID